MVMEAITAKYEPRTTIRNDGRFKRLTILPLDVKQENTTMANEPIIPIIVAISMLYS